MILAKRMLDVSLIFVGMSISFALIGVVSRDDDGLNTHLPRLTVSKVLDTPAPYYPKTRSGPSQFSSI